MRKSAFLPLLLAGCTSVNEPPGGAAMPLINTNGQPVGTVRAWQTTGGVTLRIDASGLPHGVHGLHVHAVGRCDPPDFQTAGAHWNPANRKHGLSNPAGPHAGDLRNVTVAANGVIGETVTLSGSGIGIGRGSGIGSGIGRGSGIGIGIGIGRGIGSGIGIGRGRFTASQRPRRGFHHWPGGQAGRGRRGTQRSRAGS